MKRCLAGLAVFFALAVSAMRAQGIAGDWQGTLNTGAGELRLVLHISKNSDGGLQATLDSIDQGARGIPVSKITLNDAKLHLDVDAVHGTYDGTVGSNGSVINGTWTQGRELALDFKRSGTPSQ
jgi:hypothetical protein